MLKFTTTTAVLVFITTLYSCNFNGKEAVIGSGDPGTISQDKGVKSDSSQIDEYIDEPVASTINTELLGDLNNDKVADTAFIYTPPTIKSVNNKTKSEYYFGCADENCFNKVQFSCAVPDLFVLNSVWGDVANAGDLNNDGMCELIFSPSWFTSSWSSLYVYTLKNNQWVRISAVSYRIWDEKPLISHIEKSNGKIYLTGMKFSEEAGEDIAYKSEIKF